jgi:hypothetical protein
LALKDQQVIISENNRVGAVRTDEIKLSGLGARVWTLPLSQEKTVFRSVASMSMDNAFSRRHFGGSPSMVPFLYPFARNRLLGMSTFFDGLGIKALRDANESSRPRLCENHRRPDQSDGTRQKIPPWFDSVHFSWVVFIRIKNRRINSTFSHSLDPKRSAVNVGCAAGQLLALVLLKTILRVSTRNRSGANDDPRVWATSA